MSLAFCVDEWDWAFHYALGFTRTAWRRWARMPLWPRTGKGPRSGHGSEDDWRDAVPSLRPLWAPVDDSGEGRTDAEARAEVIALRSRLNVALEVLSGALLSSVNEWRDDRSRCNLNGPTWFSSHSVLAKGHGSTHLNSTRPERCTADGLEHSWKWVNSLSGPTSSRAIRTALAPAPRHVLGA